MESKTLFQSMDNTKFLGYLGIFMLIVLFNMLTLGKPTNLLITLPQYLLVLILIINKNYNNAALFHFIFFILSLSEQKTLGLLGDESLTLYNYGTIKLFGPVRAAYVVNIILLLICYAKKYRPRKDILFYHLFKTFLFIGVVAGVIGLTGIIVHPYYTFYGFITPAIYMFVVLTTCYILLCFASDGFIKSCYYLALISTMAGVFASFLSYSVFGIVSSYSVFDIVYCADAMWFAAILVAGILSIKEKIPLIVSLIVLALIYMVVMEGKTVFNLAFAIGCLAYYVFLDKDIQTHHRTESHILRPLLIVGGVFAVTRIVLSNDSMSLYKIQSALSIFSFDLSNIADSPYIRIASLANVINDGLHNPFTLVFGNGYGGYFEDHLHLFVGLDLSKGAWPDDIISIGRFPNGHDTIVNVPFYNGLLGTYLILKISLYYLRRIKFNFMNSVAFMWILLIFYFNTLFAVMGCLFLFGGEYNVNGYNMSRSGNGNIDNPFKLFSNRNKNNKPIITQ